MGPKYLGDKLVVADLTESTDVVHAATAADSTRVSTKPSAGSLAASATYAQQSPRASSRSSPSSRASSRNLQGGWRALRHQLGLQVHPPEDRGAIGVESCQRTCWHGYSRRYSCPSQQTWHGRICITPSFSRAVYGNYSHPQRRRDRPPLTNTKEAPRGQHRRRRHHRGNLQVQKPQAARQSEGSHQLRHPLGG